MGLLVNRFRPNVVTTTADFLFNWAHRYSMWPLILGTACCAIEMMAVGISRFDMLERFGMLYRFSPRQSDVMLVCGTVTKKFAPVMRTIWDPPATSPDGEGLAGDVVSAAEEEVRSALTTTRET